MIHNLFRKNKYSTGFLVGPTYFHMILRPTSRKTKKTNPLKMSVPITFECLVFFHSVSFVSKFMESTNNKPSLRNVINMKHFTGTVIGVNCQTLCKAWTRLAVSINIPLVSTMFCPFMVYKYATCSFDVIHSKSHGFSPKSQESEFKENDKPTLISNLVCT